MSRAADIQPTTAVAVLPFAPAPPPCRAPSASPCPQATPRASAQGLSRLEFAVCCAIVGVLLSVLLPRLAEWQANTRQVRLQAAMAAVQNAIPLFRARCSRAAGQPCDQLVIDGQPIAGAHGHAAASPEGIARLAALSPDLALRSGTRDGVPSLTVAVPSQAATPCEFTYVQAPQAGAAPRIDRHSASCP